MAQKLRKSFNATILMTEGLYKIFRNPMYVSTTIIINYILFQIFIKKEYNYLEEKYGEEYKFYLRKVWCKYL